MRKILLAVAGLAVLGLVGWGGAHLLERRRTVKEIRALRDSLYRVRVAADSCRNEVARAERTFRSFDGVVDSLRGEVRAFEELDERGVPEEEYEVYLEAFDGYNESVADWRTRADSLRARDVACRRIVELHNALSDSLRGRLEEAGISPGS